MTGEQAIHDLEVIKEEFIRKTRGACPACLDYAIEAIRKQIWIPIKTRKPTEEEKEEYPDCEFMYECKLPEDGEEVLVTTWGGNTALDTFCRDDGCYFEYGCDEGDVIAWMPKPEPYREERQGDAE